MSFSSLSYASTLECSARTFRSAGLAWKPIFAWVPSQKSLLLEPPHLHTGSEDFAVQVDQVRTVFSRLDLYCMHDRDDSMDSI